MPARLQRLAHLRIKVFLRPRFIRAGPVTTMLNRLSSARRGRDAEGGIAVGLDQDEQAALRRSGVTRRLHFVVFPVAFVGAFFAAVFIAAGGAPTLAS